MEIQFCAGRVRDTGEPSRGAIECPLLNARSWRFSLKEPSQMAAIRSWRTVALQPRRLSEQKGDLALQLCAHIGLGQEGVAPMPAGAA